MKLNRCFFCNKYTTTPIHLTEINKKGKIESYDMCQKCGEAYLKEESPEKNKFLDLTHITTPEQLLEFLSKNYESSKPPCKCGLTEREFDRQGRFGCPHCYLHFTEKLEEAVFPFHGGSEHVGKRPKARYVESLMLDPKEKLKVLKLRYAQALELEKYEAAAKLKIEINKLTSELHS